MASCIADCCWHGIVEQHMAFLRPFGFTSLRIHLPGAPVDSVVMRVPALSSDFVQPPVGTSIV
eukprot:1668918-Lingulodinium_polyedra.AAC.1